MRLSDLHPDEVQPISTGSSSTQLKLSDLHPDDVTAVSTNENKHPILDKALEYAKPIGRAALDFAQLDPLGFHRATMNEPAQDVREAAGRAALQGMTFGHSDEAVGAGNAVSSALTGENPENAYIDARDINREQNALAKKEHSVVYPIAEFAGGMAAPGVGLLGKASEAVKVGTKGLPFAARMTARIGTGAGLGALAGGIGGEGYSEASTPEELEQDIQHSGKWGGLIGGGLSTAAESIGALKSGTRSGLEGGNLEKKIIKPFEKGVEGEKLTVPVQTEKLAQTSKEFGTALSNKVKDLQNQYTQLLGDFAKSGGKVDLAEQAQAIEKNADELLNFAKDSEVIREINLVRSKVRNYVTLPSTKTINTTEMVPQAATDTSGGLIAQEPQYTPINKQTTIDIPGETELGPYHAKELETNLGDITQAGSTPVETSTGKKFALDTKKIISNKVGEIPQLAQTNEQYHKLNQAVNEIGIDLGDLKLQDFGTGKKLASDVMGKLNSLIETSGKEGLGEAKASEKLKNIFDALDQIDPNISAQFRERINQVAENYNLAKGLSGFGHAAGTGWLGAIGGGLLKGAGKIANTAGLAVNKYGGNFEGMGNASDVSSIVKQSKPAQVSEAAYKMDDGQLDELANNTASTPGLENDTRHLKNAIKTNNTITKNASIFNMLQKKEGRDALRGMVK